MVNGNKWVGLHYLRLHLLGVRYPYAARPNTAVS